MGQKQNNMDTGGFLFLCFIGIVVLVMLFGKNTSPTPAPVNNSFEHNYIRGRLDDSFPGMSQSDKEIAAKAIEKQIHRKDK